MRQPTPLPVRIEKYSSPAPSGCILWTGARDRHGYGHLKVGGKLLRAHRVAYELRVGPIPQGLQLDHLCRVRHCINPTHLEPVTSRTNTLRSPIAPAAIHARKTQCNAGHALDGANLYVDPSGYRHCRECRRRRTAEWRARAA